MKHSLFLLTLSTILLICLSGCAEDMGEIPEEAPQVYQAPENTGRYAEMYSYVSQHSNGDSFYDDFDEFNPELFWVSNAAPVISKFNHSIDEEPARGGSLLNCWEKTNVSFNDGGVELTFTPTENHDYYKYAGGELASAQLTRFGLYTAEFKAAKAVDLVTSMQIHSMLPSSLMESEYDGGFVSLAISGNNPGELQLLSASLDHYHRIIKLALDFDASEETHKYSILWLPDRVHWFVDDVEVYVFTLHENWSEVPLSKGNNMIPLNPGLFEISLLGYAGDGGRELAAAEDFSPPPMARFENVGFTPLEEMPELASTYPASMFFQPEPPRYRHGKEFFTSRQTHWHYTPLLLSRWESIPRLYEPEEAISVPLFEFPYGNSRVIRADPWIEPITDGDAELLNLAQKGLDDEVRQRILDGADPNVWIAIEEPAETWEESLLSYYIGRKNREMVEFLLENGAGFLLTRSQELFSTVHNKDVEMLELLCSYGAGVADPEVGPILMNVAFKQNDPETATLLFNLGALANMVEGESIHLEDIAISAAGFGLLEILQWFDDQEVELPSEAYTAASKSNHNHILKYVLSTRILSNAQHVLSHGVTNSNYEILELMTNLNYEYSPTLTTYTLKTDDLEMIQYLVEEVRADPFMPTEGFDRENPFRFGQTAVFDEYRRSIRYSQTRIHSKPVKVIEYLASLDYPWEDNPFLWTWLYRDGTAFDELLPLLETVVEARGEDSPVIEEPLFQWGLFTHRDPVYLQYAVDLGLNPNMLDPTGNGDNLLIAAVRHKDVEVIPFLLELGVDAEYLNPEGLKALDVAREKDLQEAILLLGNTSL